MKKLSLLASTITVISLSACQSTTSQEPKRPLTPEEIAKSISSYEKAYYHILTEETHMLPNSVGSIRVVAATERYEKDKKTPELSSKLHIVKPSDSTKVVALKTLALIFSMPTGGSTYRTNDKNELLGNPVDVPNIPAITAFSPIRDYLFQRYGNQSSNTKFSPFYIISERFYLIYEKYAGDSDKKYRLIQILNFRKPFEDKLGQAIYFRCIKRNTVYPLKEWEKDNYQLVKDSSKEYTQECVDELLSKYRNTLDAAYSNSTLIDQSSVKSESSIQQ